MNGATFSLSYYDNPQRWEVINWNGAIIATMDDATTAVGLFSDLVFYCGAMGQTIGSVLATSNYAPRHPITEKPLLAG